MHKILQYLYLGDDDDAKNYKLLRKEGITHVINAAIELKEYHPDSFVYLSLKLEDCPKQCIRKACEKSHKFIQNAIRRGGKVFVHCYAGISRSSSMVIHHLIKQYKMHPDKALKFVQNIRKIVNPNSGFKKYLKSCV